jgi:hypothetical protein
MDHTDEGKKKNSGTDPFFSSLEMEKSSWVQRRSVDIYKKKYPVRGALVDNSKWGPCYKQAAQEWDEQHGKKAED